MLLSGNIFPTQINLAEAQGEGAAWDEEWDKVEGWDREWDKGEEWGKVWAEVKEWEGVARIDLNYEHQTRVNTVLLPTIWGRGGMRWCGGREDS